MHRKWEKRVIFVRFNLYPDTNAHHRHRSDYNMEAYLCTSLDRLLQQSFQDYEILLIDDGSKDSSGEICDRYAREHSRIRSSTNPTED